jgi:hypothetical protein
VIAGAAEIEFMVPRERIGYYPDADTKRIGHCLRIPGLTEREVVMRSLIGAGVAMGALLALAGVAVAAPQPHMEAALAALENARSEIGIADQARDHGGHAGAATNLIDQAIREVREGIRFRNAHGP